MHESVTKDQVQVLRLTIRFIGPFLLQATRWFGICLVRIGCPVIRDKRIYPVNGCNPDNPYIPSYRIGDGATPVRTVQMHSFLAAENGLEADGDLSARQIGEVHLQCVSRSGQSRFDPSTEETRRSVLPDRDEVIGQGTLSGRWPV